MGSNASEGLGLRQHTWPDRLRAPDPELLNQLYVPALRCAVSYDRCCGYFSSHVLSVAARGFGGFIENLQRLGDQAPKPAVRLLVNEHLDPDDLRALLTTGDQEPLVRRLLAQFKTPQSALEKNRLAMLAWLVAKGWLEVRVGVMRRFGGMSHAKFGVITDEYGQRVAFMGSDNESGSALVENYEEVELRTSWNDSSFTDYYRSRFEELWQDRDEYVTSLPLPDAVRLELVKLAPTEPPGEVTLDLPSARAAMLWNWLAVAPYLPDGQLACDATAPVDLWPHQGPVVDDCAAAFPAGRMLCDEVGMGKTIEAILALRRLLTGGGVQRALLLVPAGLLKQWQDELREKGGLIVPICDGGKLMWPDGRAAPTDPATALAHEPVLLLSREWARLSGNREAVLSAPPWDLVLLDEAHAARRRSDIEGEFNSGTLLLELLRDLQLKRRTRGILLLSATPMQTRPWEPWDLLSVLGIGGRWMVEFDEVRGYYGALAKLRTKALPLSEAERVARLILSDRDFPAGPGGIVARSVSQTAQNLAFHTMGPQRAGIAEWLRHGAPLGRRMHRNTRRTLHGYYQMGLLPQPPARRDVHDVLFDYEDQAERDSYVAITSYIDRRFDELEREKGGKGFVMTVYRRRAASCPLALRRSLERRRQLCEKVMRREWWEAWLKPEGEQMDARDLADAGMDERIDPAAPSTPQAAEQEAYEIDHLLQRLDALGSTDSKLMRFSRLLDEVAAGGRSVLVFSEYQDTMEYLRDRLRPVYGQTLGCFSGSGGQVLEGGQWHQVSRAEVTERLSDGRIRILICTDAASEGLNLQAASALINYDLPWNPSKVEQRIGRIDRIGQQAPVLPIRNLFLDDSVDLRVYELLRERCGLFEHYVGPMQPVLAAARGVLQRPLSSSEMDGLLASLKDLAGRLQADEMVMAAYADASAKRQERPTPPVSRPDLEQALEELAKLEGPVRASRRRKGGAWHLHGIRRAADVTTEREALERDPSLLPLTLGSQAIQDLAGRLPVGSRLPLVLAQAQNGAFRCAEARWLGERGIVTVKSAAELRELLARWAGQSASPALVVIASQEAQRAARERVDALAEATQRTEQDGLRAQVEAARNRLLRELGRTLRCMSDGNLTELLRQAVQREGTKNGRYHQAVRLLGDYPEWPADETRDIDLYVASLSAASLRARVAGSEVDAALADPRWAAAETLANECARGQQ